MKQLIYISTVSLILVFFVVNCDGSLIGSSHITDPNNPSVEQIMNNATKPEIQNLVTGLELRNRQYANNLIPLLGSLGREVWQLDDLEPRFITEWLGIDGDAETDPSFFASGDTYDTPYETIKQGNLILESLNNTDAFTDAEKNGVRGYVKTIQGFQYLIPLLTQYQNGIRIDVSDPQNLGPILSYDDALSKIRNIIDDGYSDLQNAGDSFFFNLSAGFADFSNPTGMAQLNRAIAARAAIYAKDWQGALDALSNAKPFFELADGEEVMNKGAYLSYGNPPDTFNPLYRAPGKRPDNIMVVHPSVIRDTLAGDLRITRKFRQVSPPFNNPNLPVDASYADNRFSGVDAHIPMLRNEELILSYAEAKTQLGGATNFGEAIDAINHIRNTWNLPDYSGSVTKDALIDEVLLQRRYSLWGEFGHRWIDMRRYGRLDQIDQNDKIVGTIFEQFALPQSEKN